MNIFFEVFGKGKVSFLVLHFYTCWSIFRLIVVDIFVLLSTYWGEKEIKHMYGFIWGFACKKRESVRLHGLLFKKESCCSNNNVKEEFLLLTSKYVIIIFFSRKYVRDKWVLGSYFRFPRNGVKIDWMLSTRKGDDYDGKKSEEKRGGDTFKSFRSRSEIQSCWFAPQ